MGCGITYCRIHIAEEKASTMQCSYKHNKLYVATLIVIAGSDNTW